VIRCDAFIELLDEFLTVSLPSQTLDDCNNHAAHCADCSAYMNSYQTTMKAVRKLGTFEAPLPAQPANFNNQILARLASICG
jgi:hypothetical protein